MKATEGIKINDKKFPSCWSIAKNIKLTRGAYHFFKSNSSAEVQFENYRNSVTLNTNDLPPILDVEDDDIDMQKVNIWLKLAEKYQPKIFEELKIKNDNIVLQINKAFIDLTMKAHGKADLYFHAYFWEKYLKSLQDA